MRRAVALLRSSLLLGLMLAPALQARDKLLQMPWWLYEGEHFSVVTNIPDKGPELIRRLELFRAVVLQFTGLRAGPDRLPTRAVIFARQSEFARIVDRGNALGYTSTTLRNNRMVASGGRFDVARRHVMFHEYVHYLLRSATSQNHPAWYDEGLADMLSTVVERDGRVLVGAAPPAHLRMVTSNTRLLPASSFVHTDDLSAWHPLKVSMFYATSWMFVNYIHADRSGARQASMRDYLGRVQRGEPRADAFVRAFATTPRGMARKSLKHVRKHTRAFLEYPRDTFTINATSSARRLSVEEVAYELSYLAMFSNPRLARKLVQEILDDDPHNTAMLTALAVTYQAEQAYRRGIDLARAAVARARRDKVRNVVLEIDLADMLMVWNQDACVGQTGATALESRGGRDKKAVAQDTPEVCRSRYVEAKEVYQRGLELEPDNPELRSGLAWALLKLDQQLSQAARHIAVALDYQPWSPTLHYRAGMIHKGIGQEQLAENYLQKALYWSKNRELRDDAATALAELSRSDTGG